MSLLQDLGTRGSDRPAPGGPAVAVRKVVVHREEVRTEAGRKIRSAFVVGEGYECLLTADYSQIEMRVMAHLSKDDGLIEAYRAGEDLHNFVGSRVFDAYLRRQFPTQV